MLKLFKDLTRPPEPLSPRPSPRARNSDLPSQPYAPRVPKIRGRSPAPGSSTGGSAPPSPALQTKELEDEHEEEDEAAKQVDAVLKALRELEEKEEDDKTVMAYVEILSQLNSVRPTKAALRTFRRMRGAQTLLYALDHGLARHSPNDTPEEEKQLEEVQRMEGIRIWFEVLGLVLQDRENHSLFQLAVGGYSCLLPTLRKLGSQSITTKKVSNQIDPAEAGPSSPSRSQTSISTTPPEREAPNHAILAQLLAYIMDNNYTLLSLITPSTGQVDLSAVFDQLGDVVLSRPSALPLLWAYLFGSQTVVSLPATSKGKERLRDNREATAFSAGIFESITPEWTRLIELTFAILQVAASTSTANLFALRSHLPELPAFLLTRLYGIEQRRQYEITFPPREDWYVPTADDLEDDQEIAWKPPTESLRKVYLGLLRRLLESGVDQHIVWRLFTLVKVEASKSKGTANGHDPELVPAARPMTKEPSDSTQSTNTGQIEFLDSPSISPSLLSTAPPTPSPSMPRTLLPRLNLDGVRAGSPTEQLNTEILDLLRHAMKSKWPDSFVFRGASGGSEGGLELREMLRSWPAGSKGFNFSCWVHINKLNRPITLLHASQSGQPHPLFQIRILENSQITLLASVYKPPSETTAESSNPPPEDIICSAPDALIPHHQWVHFAIGCRKPKGLDVAEARVFVNGVRVGAMRIPYPVPAPPPPPQTHTLHAKPTSPADAIRLTIGRTFDGNATGEGDLPNGGMGKEEENEWMLGRTLLVEDPLPEDIVLLIHHLGPRYHGNFQEPLGKFLTYEAATSINVYLSAQAQGATDKRIFSTASNSVLVKAIRQGPAFPEENILLSLCSKDIITTPSGLACVNGAVPHPFRAKQLRYGVATFVGGVGSIEGFASHALDESVSCVGGGAVVLKMIDLAQTSDELAATLSMLRDMIKDSWSASEEIERIRGYDMLAAILRPKMINLMDVNCTKIILSMLGVNMDKPETATVHNSAAYRSLGLEFEVWARASLGVVTLYLQHFEHLLTTSKHSRYNILRTFQKTAVVRKLLYALRSGLFDLSVVPVVVDTLKLILVARWSAEDSIKPVFSYLVSTLCQGLGSVYPALSILEPPPSQAPAAQILAMVATLCHNNQRLNKLHKSLALHRLLVIFVSSNSAPYILISSLDILEHCLKTIGLEAFQRSFEAEGGFALLARTLGLVWSKEIQSRVFIMLVGPGENDGKSLACPPLVSTLLSALDCLLQGGEEFSSRVSRRGSMSSMRSVTMTPVVPEANGTGNMADDTRLESLLNELAKLYRSNSLFRKAFTNPRVEQMLPNFVDFAAVSLTTSNPENAALQRKSASVFLAAMIDKNKLSHSLVNQMKLVVEQLNMSPNRSTNPLTHSPTSSRPSSISFGGSFTGRLGSTPPSTPSTPGPIPRRRPSNDAGMPPSSIGSKPRLRPLTSERRPPALKRVLTGESILEGGKDKNAAWKLIIIQTDSQSHSKMLLERKEHWRRLSDTDWPALAAGLRAENGLWPEDEGLVRWRLDGSEGPLRMRNRLERVKGVPEAPAPAGRMQQRKLRDAIPSVDELSSAVSRIDLPPWEDPFALALGQAAPIAEEMEAPLVDPSAPAPAPTPTPESRLDDEAYVEIEENTDDKMRRIAKTLQAGDVVEEAHNIVRIVGVDACPGLLIIGRKNLYLMDGLVQTAEGEVIDARDAPRDVLTIPGTLADLSGAEQESHRWSYNEIVESNKRAFLFRDVALELYFSDKRNFLIVFKDQRERQGVVSKLLWKTDQSGGISRSLIGSFVVDTVTRAMDKSEQHLEALTRKWQNREISNFAYLSLLNQHANRTPNDVTQYPVFPWVLADYTSPNLDFSKHSTYRDLTMPMGALTAGRREAAVERYSATEGVGEKPFHYGTHYSSSMIVCGFMIRLSPFTEIFLALQGGNFDLADRLFSSVARAWESASADNRGDVRELIPEFFYSSAFLLNVNHHDFGRKQVTGDSVDNVILPPWALGDQLLFAHRHREALESDIVSRTLPAWIDLTFGYKQRDPAAYNCFHPLSYRGAVDLESMEDESEKAASTAIIHNFGQTPLQIFKSPHPTRYLNGRSSLPFDQRFGVAEQWQLLMRSILPITETVVPIHQVAESTFSDAKPSTHQKYRLTVPGTLLSVQYGFTDDSLRVYHTEIGATAARLVLIVEGVPIENAVFAAPQILVTVSKDSVLSAWRLHIKGNGNKRGDVSLQREGTLRGHTSKVTCLAASSAWSFLVTGSQNGLAIIWDMNRLRYTRTLILPVRESIRFCAIHEPDGQIALATSRNIFMFSINGHPIASALIDDSYIPRMDFDAFDSSVFSDAENDTEFTGGISFLNREFLPFGVLFVIGVGSEVALYRCVPGTLKPNEVIEDAVPWKLVEQGRLARSDDHAGGDCCMVKFIGETLYAAFEPGDGSNKYLLYQWSLPEGGARHVTEAVGHTCMAAQCGRHFGLLEPRRHCGGCGGAFCGTHAVHVETLEHRYCETCRSQLSSASSSGVLNYRRDSAVPISRRASFISQPGSRRASFINASRSRSGSRRESVSRAQANSSPGTASGDQSPLQTTTRSRESTPLLMVPPH